MEKKAVVYIDDRKKVIETFKNAMQMNWHLNYDVLHNTLYGKITPTKYKKLESEIFTLIKENISRIECVFLDLDFSGGTSKKDRTGFIIGQEIRKKWPLLPIILTTIFTEYDILKKGMVFDFDNIIQPGNLIRTKVEHFKGLINFAKEKRYNILTTISDIPISYQLGTHLYFKSIEHLKEQKDYAFVAMPFDTKIARADVYEIAIKTACQKAGITPLRVDYDKKTISIIDNIVHLIYNCRLMIVDITGENPNVMYELGIAHSANKKCITLSQKGSVLKLPFDITHLKAITYNQNELSELISKLRKAINEWL